MEVLFDPPRRARLPIDDQEIIDRVLTAQTLAGRPITLVTYDTNQALQALTAGLRALRLRDPVEDEPEPSTPV